MNKIEIEIDIRHRMNVLISDIFNAQRVRKTSTELDRSLDLLKDIKNYLDMEEE